MKHDLRGLKHTLELIQTATESLMAVHVNNDDITDERELSELEEELGESLDSLEDASFRVMRLLEEYAQENANEDTTQADEWTAEKAGLSRDLRRE